MIVWIFSLFVLRYQLVCFLTLNRIITSSLKDQCLLESEKSTRRLDFVYNVLFLKESKYDKMPTYIKPKWQLHGCW